MRFMAFVVTYCVKHLLATVSAGLKNILKTHLQTRSDRICCVAGSSLHLLHVVCVPLVATVLLGCAMIVRDIWSLSWRLTSRMFFLQRNREAPALPCSATACLASVLRCLSCSENTTLTFDNHQLQIQSTGSFVTYQILRDTTGWPCDLRSICRLHPDISLLRLPNRQSISLEATVNDEELAPWPPPAGDVRCDSWCIGNEDGQLMVSLQSLQTLANLRRINPTTIASCVQECIVGMHGEGQLYHIYLSNS